MLIGESPVRCAVSSRRPQNARPVFIEVSPRKPVRVRRPMANVHTIKVHHNFQIRKLLNSLTGSIYIVNQLANLACSKIN